MSNLLHDLRYTLRGLARRPGLTVVVLATLALGIGAVTAIFSVVDALLLRPLPYDDPDDLVVVWERNIPRERDANVVAVPNFLAWKESSSFSDLAAMFPTGVTLTGDGPPDRVETALVTPGLFAVLAAEPILGRRFLPAEAEEGNYRVAVLSHGLWQRRFGGAADVVGRTLTVDGDEHESWA